MSTLPGINDHEIIYIASSIDVQLPKMSKRKILVWSRADITTIKSIGRNFNTCFLEKHSMTSPVNTSWDEFQDMCQRWLDLKKTLDFPIHSTVILQKTTYVQLCKIITISILLAKISIVKKRFRKNVVRLIQIMYQLY